MENKVKSVVISDKCIIKNAIKQLNENRLQILLVVDDDDRFVGTVTDGDIRRAILDNVSLEQPVSTIMNKKPKYVYRGQEEVAKELMIKYKIKTIPVIDNEKRVIDLILMEEFIGVKCEYSKKNNSVFIMAGGKGTRLDPFTKILPKPLIPIGDKPIIEIIMKNFKNYGFNDFIISLNYKAEIIKLYFAENPDGYNIDFVHEKEFLGTAGSLRLAIDKLNNTFIVSNCDVIIDIDFDELLKYHEKSGNDATIVGVVKNMQIPYGVMDVNNGELINMIEKPEYNFVINSGVYVLEPELIRLIPDGQSFNMPDLLLKSKDYGYKVGVYPVSSKWFDVGQWEEYRSTLEYFKKVDSV
ncbi:nucleotidyl transferase [Thermoanaerobacterium sp. PSU-2]|uniref:nucleotidyltransferase family protein n=1 Tax=Thermoanaerobacterium sp. PSU-2 TaxID=1930849 RepID=UPI000A1513CB|nr:nucleotidyltransferase family protein [Thermoanaerobacterium sp. PSU-2]ORX24522.1 nucleotidyl transferase [Thermoanaerobacterium sp. PSU-2]